jgi:hypothetical protein
VDIQGLSGDPEVLAERVARAIWVVSQVGEDLFLAAHRHSRVQDCQLIVNLTELAIVNGLDLRQGIVKAGIPMNVKARINQSEISVYLARPGRILWFALGLEAQASLWAEMQRNLGPGPRRTSEPHARERLWVYGRARRPCRRCGTLVERRRQGELARSTYWCPRCQPA